MHCTKLAHFYFFFFILATAATSGTASANHHRRQRHGGWWWRRWQRQEQHQQQGVCVRGLACTEYSVLSVISVYVSHSSIFHHLLLLRLLSLLVFLSIFFLIFPWICWLLVYKMYKYNIVSVCVCVYNINGKRMTAMKKRKKTSAKAIEITMRETNFFFRFTFVESTFRNKHNSIQKESAFRRYGRRLLAYELYTENVHKYIQYTSNFTIHISHHIASHPPSIQCSILSNVCDDDSPKDYFLARAKLALSFVSTFFYFVHYWSVARKPLERNS